MEENKIDDMWEDKYVVLNEKENDVVLYLDKYGAVLYALNNLNEIQKYYESEEDYKKSIMR